MAEQEGISINQLIATSLAEKMSALMTSDYLDARAKRGSARAFQRVLRKVKDRAPGDRAGVRVPTGTFVHISGGTVHGFRIDSEMARYLILTTPRHAQFYRAITSPSPGAAIDGALIKKACQEYGIEFVGALPE